MPKSTPLKFRVVVLLFVLLTRGEVDFESPEWISLFPANIRIANNPTLIWESTKTRLPLVFLSKFFHLLYQVCSRHSQYGLLAEITAFPTLSHSCSRMASSKAFGSTGCMQKNLPVLILHNPAVSSPPSCSSFICNSATQPQNSSLLVRTPLPCSYCQPQGIAPSICYRPWHEWPHVHFFHVLLNINLASSHKLMINICSSAQSRFFFTLTTEFTKEVIRSWDNFCNEYHNQSIICNRYYS